MSTPVTLPALGESVTEGTVSRWLKQVGDTIAADEPLVEVSTDKVDTEIPSPASGVVLEIRVGEDETVEVGTVLAVIGDASESGAPAAQPQEPAAAPQAPAAEPQQPAAPEPTSTPAPSAPSGPASGTEVLLPALGESVTEGTVSRWLKAVGDEIEADEALVEVSTDKVDTEVPSPVSGTVLEIRVGEDETVDVGTVLAVIGDAAAAPATPAPAPTPEPAPAPEPTPAPAPEPTPAPAAPAPTPPKTEVVAAAAEDETLASIGHGQRTAGTPQPPVSPQVAPRRAASLEGRSEIYVTPVVRKLASQHGVDLESVTGTGVGGRIRKEDVLAAAEAAKAAAAEAARAAEKATATPAPTASAPAAKQPPAAASPVRGTTEKMSRLRSTIARRMVESLQISAQLTATVEVDVTAISRLRAQVKEEFKRREGVSLSYLPFITKATIEALKQFPKLNATIDTEKQTITYPDSEHVGIAVDTEKGLLVPVIKDAGDLNIAGLAKKIGDLAARTRASKVTPDELTGGTFTITNYGSAGSLFDTPIVNQPQVAILGTGALVKRPVVVTDPALGEVIAIRDMMYLSLSYDHRLVDGALAARFLSAIKARLEGGDFGGDVS